MKLPPYPRYKPSGIDWLGDVPEHWDIVPFKHRCLRSALYGANIPGEEYAPDGVRFLRTTDIDDFGNLQPRGVFIEPEQAQGYVLADGDILLSRSGTIGRAFVYSSHRHPKSAYAGYLVRFVPSPRLNPALVFYFTKSTTFRDWLDTQVITSTIGNVNGQKYAQCPLPLPGSDEQHAIADFLDRETAKIDTLVAKKRTLIERLKEKRTALISRTVTRGLPPDTARAAGLDPHPKLKPSGVEWLGDTPEHWDVRPLRHISNEITVGVVVNPSSYVSDEGVPFLLGGDIREFLIDTSKCNRCSRDTSDGPLRKSRLSSGDLVVVRVGYPGLASVVPPALEGANCASMMIVRRHPRFCSQWLAYLFNSQVGRDQVEIVQYGAAQKQFNIGHAVGFVFPFPPVDEQRAIAEFLDRETARLERMIAKIETAIERLHEYRTALITAAVTGKFDVRETAA